MLAVLFLVLCVVLAVVAEDRSISLTYFNGKGNAEVSRMMLHLADVPFDDIRAGRDFVWADMKAANGGSTNMNRLPVMQWGSIEIGQTKPIERLIAKTYGYHGSSDVEAAQIDAIVEHVTDIRMDLKMVKTRREGDELAEAVGHFMKGNEEGGALHWVSRVEKALDDGAKGGFAVGNKLSLADFYLHQLLRYVHAPP
jgi:glutathione S-transferase